MRYSIVCAPSNAELLLKAALRSYDDNAISTTITVHCSGRCVLQYREALYVGCLNLAKVTLKSINKNKRRAVSAECAYTTYPEL